MGETDEDGEPESWRGKERETAGGPSTGHSCVI